MDMNDDFVAINKYVISVGFLATIAGLLILMFNTFKFKENSIKVLAHYYPDYSVSKRLKWINRLLYTDIESFQVNYLSKKKGKVATSLEIKLKSLKNSAYLSVFGYSKKQVNEITRILHEKITDK